MKHSFARPGADPFDVIVRFMTCMVLGADVDLTSIME